MFSLGRHIHFEKSESGWLHERDHGDTTAGQTEPMERDGAGTRGQRFERQGVLQAGRYRNKDILLSAAKSQGIRDQTDTFRAREIGLSARAGAVYTANRIYCRAHGAKYRHQNDRHNR